MCIRDSRQTELEAAKAKERQKEEEERENFWRRQQEKQKDAQLRLERLNSRLDQMEQLEKERNMLDAMQREMNSLSLIHILIVGAESRGFIFGMPVAYETGKAFILARKPGKLPRETVSAEYELEYGTGSIEIHKDAIRPGQKAVMIDDLIATGGTAKAIAGLVEQLGGQVVKLCFVMELAGLKGREQLAGYQVESAIRYEGK